MENSREDILLKLQLNASKIKETLKSKNLQLAKLDNLFRERNETFEELKKLLTTNSINEKEESMMRSVVKDNQFILNEMEKIKQDMESSFHKKENDANKISKYSINNLKK